MLPQSIRSADPRQVCLVAALVLAGTSAAAAQETTTALPNSSSTPSGQGALRTFTVDKPPESASSLLARPIANAAPHAPRSRESLRTMIGVGYVEGADWGSEILASGMVAGAQVQLNSLVTSGRDGFLFDHGTLSVFDPDTRWRIEAGDVFSHLRGASLGGRISWPSAGNRRPAIAVYTPRRGTPDQPTVVTYRDQVQVGGQTLLDAEVASDRSFLLRNRLTSRRFEVETFYRSQRSTPVSRDASVSAGIRLWAGISVNGGVFRSLQSQDDSDWRMIAVRFPLGRTFDLTLERAFSSSRGASHSTSALMAGIAAGDFRFFHRYQQGEYDFARGGLSGSLDRQQTRSMTSYAPGPRLNLTLQLATQHTETGQVQHWEELQATIKLTSTTMLRTITAVPDLRDPDRFQAYLRQDLPRRFALQADYGRMSAYQSIARELDRSRFKLMLFKTIDIATPARGARISGRVLDDVGRGVAGARVKLGPYSADADASGAYRFEHVPAGDYEISLDPALLPADFAWDGRRDRLAVAAGRSVIADLRVTPLNAIHGRVYVDRNHNERYDSGEGIAGAVIKAGERLTATDRDGSYAFYNLWPDAYVVGIQSLPSDFQASTEEKRVTLLDGAPVTGVDFRVRVKEKPIIWGASR